MSQTKHYQPIGFNTRLHDTYIKSGLEVTEIAKKTGIARATVYGILYYGQTPNISTIAKIAKLLNVSLDYLVYGEEVR
jgi:DNA-binding phage protein